MPPKRAYKIAKPVNFGFEIFDSSQSSGWVIGETIGQGGFGRLYAAASTQNPGKMNYVVKIEPRENGPLFTEVHFYSRFCKKEMLNEWKKLKDLSFLGIPRIVSSGMFDAPGHEQCRFLVIDRFNGSLEDVLKNHEFGAAEFPRIAIQTLNALEYIHSKGYVHADIKAGNLLWGSRNEFYLADFGLVTLYCIDGKHKPEKPSPKLVDNGTLEFCSRDAHAGLPPARRSDLEILVFNLIHWLSTSQGDAPAAAGLPWMPLISNASVRANVPRAVRDAVVRSKQHCMDNVSEFAQSAGFGSLPGLVSILQSVGSLAYAETPDYSKVRGQLETLSKKLPTTPAGGTTKKVSRVSSTTPNRKKATTSHHHVVVARKRPSSPSPPPSAITNGTATTTIVSAVGGPALKKTARGAASKTTASDSHPKKPTPTKVAVRKSPRRNRGDDDHPLEVTTGNGQFLLPSSPRPAQGRRGATSPPAFEPSDDEEPITRRRRKSGRTGRAPVANTATQTSPEMLRLAREKALMEDRRRNFF